MFLTAGKFGQKTSEKFSVLPAKDIYVVLFMVSCLQQSDTLAKIRCLPWTELVTSVPRNEKSLRKHLGNEPCRSLQA